MNGRESIYVMGSACGQFIKLGWSENQTPHVRFRQHRSEKNRGIRHKEVIAYVSGVRADETFLKIHFAKFLVNLGAYGDEVFLRDTPVLLWALWLRQQWFARHDPSGHEMPDYEPFSAWLPNDQRICLPPQEDSLLRPEDPWWFLSEEVEDSKDQYISPPEFISAVREAFGGAIDLDPASDSCANRHVKAPRFFTQAMDGLAQSWDGPHGPSKVWVSVPFNQLSKWLSKLVAEMAVGHVAEAIVHAEARMLGADYFQPYLKGKYICVVNKKYDFGGRGTLMPAQQDKQLLIYFGPNGDKFTAAVKHLGHVYSAIT